MKEFYICDCARLENQTITSLFVVAAKQVKSKKSGELYLSVTLADRSGQLQANMWDNVADTLDAFEQDDFVKVKGMVHKYNGRWQLTIHKLRKLDDTEIDYSDYLPKTSKDIEQLWRTLSDFVESFENHWLKSLLKEFMADEAIVTAYKNAPAAKTLHHAFVGGLLDHVVSLFTVCDLAARNYPQVNRDLLLTGVFLHDIGKLHELAYQRSIAYTTEGQLLGHMIIELEMLHDKLAHLPGFPRRVEDPDRAHDHQPSRALRIWFAEAAHVSRGAHAALSRRPRLQDGEHARAVRARGGFRQPVDQLQPVAGASAAEYQEVSGEGTGCVARGGVAKGRGAAGNGNATPETAAAQDVEAQPESAAPPNRSRKSRSCLPWKRWSASLLRTRSRRWPVPGSRRNPAMLDFSRFEWLSFDCYGTLIDWETGLLGYLRPLLEKQGHPLSDAQILTFYSEFEPRAQSGTYHCYREVLAQVVRDFANELHFSVSTSEANGLAESIRTWQPFADTAPALHRLQSRYKLAVLSNIDDDLFAYTSPKLKTCFDAVVTAQQVHSYKPSFNNFEALLRRYDIPRERLLHVAESLYHDVVPAHALEIATVWVNRRQGKAAAASKLVEAHPDLEVPDVGALAEMAVFG